MTDAVIVRFEDVDLTKEKLVLLEMPASEGQKVLMAVPKGARGARATARMVERAKIKMSHPGDQRLAQLVLAGVLIERVAGDDESST